MKITYAKTGEDVVATDGTVFKDAWFYVVITDPATGDIPTDAKGRYIKWREINVLEGWGCIFDQDACEHDGEERFLRVEAPWIRLLEMDLDIPDPEPTEEDIIV